MDNEKLVKMTAFRVAFLMQHQEITDVVELEAMALLPVNPPNDEPPIVNKESAEYLAGASDALINLVACLKQKGYK